MLNKRILNTLAALSILFVLGMLFLAVIGFMSPVHAADIRITRDGYIKVEVDGVIQPENYTQENTAGTAAFAASKACGGGCEAVVVSRYRYDYIPEDEQACPEVPPVVPCPECPELPSCPECPTCPESPEPPDVGPPEVVLGDVVIEWQHPTKRVNDYPLAEGDLAGTVVEWRQVGHSGWIGVFADYPDNELKLQLPPGDYEARLTSVDTQVRRDEDGNKISNEPWVSDYAQLAFTVADDGEVEQPCSLEVPANVAIAYGPASMTVSWGSPLCGEIALRQCTDAHADAHGNCWQGDVIATLDAAAGGGEISYEVIDRSNVGGAGSSLDCGFRVYHQLAGALSGHGANEIWGGEACDQ